MNKYEIKYIPQSSFETTNSSHPVGTGTGIKEAFWDNNVSIYTCIAMILNEDIINIQKKNPHILLYGKYLGGFLFESYELLPLLCILNIISDNTSYNAVYYNRTIYDPKIGVFAADEYKTENIQILSYIQIFIEEAYQEIDWRPYMPYEIQAELDKDDDLKIFWGRLSSMQQSKILNYIFPFSKASSLNEKRKSTQSLNKKQTDNIINHIKVLYNSKHGDNKSVWDELHDFETKEAVDTLKGCGIREGMTVIDMGCGNAHYTIPASIATGNNGQVTAVDISKKVIKEARNRIMQLNISNVIFLNTDENGLADYINKIDFIILYDVLHGGGWQENRNEKLKILRSLLVDGGILSLALYNEIERKADPNKKRSPKGLVSTIPITHEEAIKPYIALIESCGFKLKNSVKNGGVHFDNFHSPYYWRKFGEVRIGSLERRPIYNFIKI
jgi:SAM-dependent methyltransferase